MSIFGKIWQKISDPWGVAEKNKTREPQSVPNPIPSARAQPAPQPGASTSTAPPQGSSAPTPVDVEQVLDELASKRPGGGGNWRTSIVDLLKLLDLDSSLDARKELGTELRVNAGAPGSAEQNIALHKAVMRKLAENGGKVPADLRD